MNISTKFADIDFLNDLTKNTQASMYIEMLQNKMFSHLLPEVLAASFEVGLTQARLSRTHLSRQPCNADEDTEHRACHWPVARLNKAELWFELNKTSRAQST